MEHPISGTQEMYVYSPLSLLPNRLNIALGNETTDAGFALEPSGGSGEYLWSVLEPSSSKKAYKRSTGVVSVTRDGKISPRVSCYLNVLSTHLNFLIKLNPNINTLQGLGTAIVVVSDLRNPDMCSQSVVQVSHISSLVFATKGRVEVYLPRNPDIIESFLSSRTIDMDAEDLNPSPAQDKRKPLNLVEKQRNSILTVGLIARDTEGSIIHDCHNIALKVTPLNPSVVRVLPSM